MGSRMFPTKRGCCYKYLLWPSFRYQFHNWRTTRKWVGDKPAGINRMLVPPAAICQHIADAYAKSWIEGEGNERQTPT